MTPEALPLVYTSHNYKTGIHQSNRGVPLFRAVCQSMDLPLQSPGNLSYSPSHTSGPSGFYYLRGASNKH